jgi:hypothetical protein
MVLGEDKLSTVQLVCLLETSKDNLILFAVMTYIVESLPLLKTEKIPNLLVVEIETSCKR